MDWVGHPNAKTCSAVCSDAWKDKYAKSTKRRKSQAAHGKRWRSQPDVREHLRKKSAAYYAEHGQKPEVKERRAVYRREYVQRPGVKDQIRKYQQE